MPKEKLYYVYIVAGKRRAVYVGMTAFLMARISSHRAGEGSEFTRKYKIHRLVYHEVFHSVAAAIARETEIKKWRREKKVALIADPDGVPDYRFSQTASEIPGPFVFSWHKYFH
ncbi:MAG TPA: GIY-YIG nuclease family protein, partial [Candidatus Binatia bacterium]|nr:GIY-YIG nuclease family protein [Candidatus Binatia bacterium]